MPQFFAAYVQGHVVVGHFSNEARSRPRGSQSGRQVRSVPAIEVDIYAYVLDEIEKKKSSRDKSFVTGSHGLGVQWRYALWRM